MRDEFSAATKQTVARRAAHFCSNPECWRLTIGPHSDCEKSLSTGHAAHIHAASPEGPRYDPNQTPNQRKHITNAIWLCRGCGDLVDKDQSQFSADRLREWKASHEKIMREIADQGYSRSLALLQRGAVEANIAKRVIALLEDRRALWRPFDAEFPERVRQSLDYVRRELTILRGEAGENSLTDLLLLSVTKTIAAFFSQVEDIDLTHLRCNSYDPVWRRFRDALATLRKAIGLQLSKLAEVNDLALSDDLKSILPMQGDG